MPHPLSPALLDEISRCIADRLGLYFPENRRWDLERGLTQAAKELGDDDIGQCVQRIRASTVSRQDLEILASHLTVGETYFFRDPGSFQALETHILPRLIRSRPDGARRLRIWSAGCSTGEEAYSLAIAVSRSMPFLNDGPVTILATDINTRSLQHASAGVYGAWSFRGVPETVQARYFDRTPDGRLAVRAELKRAVEIAYLNLMDDPYPSLQNNTNAMDVIFCRNVLMYFDAAAAQQVVRRLCRALVDGGWLAVSPTEMSLLQGAPLTPVRLADAVFFRKDRVPAATPARAARVAAPAAPAPHTPPPAPAPVARTDAEAAPDPYGAAQALYDQGRYAELIDRLSDIAARTEAVPEALLLLARAHANLGDLAEAAKISDAAVEKDKLNPGAHFLRATILQEQGETGEAVAALKRAVYLDSRFVLAHVMLGNLSLRQQRYTAAAKYFDNALHLLEPVPQDEPVPESEGLTAGRLRQMIRSAIARLDKEE